jgi:hypothetical protein
MFSGACSLRFQTTGGEWIFRAQKTARLSPGGGLVAVWSG